MKQGRLKTIKVSQDCAVSERFPFTNCTVFLYATTFRKFIFINTIIEGNLRILEKLYRMLYYKKIGFDIMMVGQLETHYAE